MEDAGGSSGEGVQAGMSARVSTGVRTGRHWLVFFALAGTVVIVDQLTKAALVANLDPGQMVSVVGDWVRLVFSQNSGALFGMFRDQAILFGLASLVVIGLIVAFHGQSERSLYLSIALGFLLGGAVGNVIDRLRLGYVVDFVDIGIGGFRWYTFNVADAAISTALVMLFALAFFPRLARLGEGGEGAEGGERGDAAEDRDRADVDAAAEDRDRADVDAAAEGGAGRGVRGGGDEEVGEGSPPGTSDREDKRR